jgi:hypothetical protein
MVGSCWADLPCAETCFTGRVFVSAMTPIIFTTIGFLSCWFLLYALIEDTRPTAQIRRHKWCRQGN